MAGGKCRKKCLDYGVQHNLPVRAAHAALAAIVKPYRWSPMELTSYQKRVAAWVAIAALLGLILWLLAPVLTPFVVAAVLAYALNPLVNRLDGWFRGRMPRAVAVSIVMLLFMLAVVGVVMLIVPVAIKELPLLRSQLPVLLDKGSAWLQALVTRLGIPVEINVGTLKEWLLHYLNSGDGASSGVGSLLSSLSIGGSVALAVLGNLVLIPMALFYLLMDWDRFVFHLFRLVPRRMRESVSSFAQEADQVLGQYLRGQLLVMLILAVYYSVGLALFGLDLALPIGIFTGLAVFVPYLGFGLGLVMAALLGMLQMGLAKAALMVAVVYGLGQFIESFFLTPRLVGERIGLHPLVVIFALLAFGQLFGFVGILVALPCSAVLLVAIRRMRTHYLQSDLYKL